jgi:hypothetical protein
MCRKQTLSRPHMITSSCSLSSSGHARCGRCHHQVMLIVLVVIIISIHHRMDTHHAHFHHGRQRSQTDCPRRHRPTSAAAALAALADTSTAQFRRGLHRPQRATTQCSPSRRASLQPPPPPVSTPTTLRHTARRLTNHKDNVARFDRQLGRIIGNVLGNHLVRLPTRSAATHSTHTHAPHAHPP